MRAVIAGGTGLVGRAIAWSMTADGHEVVVLTRDARKTRGRMPSMARVIDWAPTDPRSIGLLAETLSGSDVIVHLSGARVGPWPWTRRRKSAITESRTSGVRALVAALGRLPPEHRPKALVVVSGIDAYPESGPGPDPVAMTEVTPTGTGFLAEVTRALEAEAVEAEALGVRVARLRMGHVLGRDAELVHILALPVRLFVGGRFGSGQQWVSWVHLDDAVALFRMAMTDERAIGPLNVVSPVAVRQHIFVRAIGAALHRPTRFPVPGWLLSLVLGEEASLLLGSRRAAPARALELGFAFRHPSVEATFKDILR